MACIIIYFFKDVYCSKDRNKAIPIDNLKDTMDLLMYQMLMMNEINYKIINKISSDHAAFVDKINKELDRIEQ